LDFDEEREMTKTNATKVREIVPDFRIMRNTIVNSPTPFR